MALAPLDCNSSCRPIAGQEDSPTHCWVRAFGLPASGVDLIAERRRSGDRVRAGHETGLCSAHPAVTGGLGQLRLTPFKAWWRRRELNPRPKQCPPGYLRACPGFWFSLGGSSRRDPLSPAAVSVPPQGRSAPEAAIRSFVIPLPSPPDLTGGSTRDL